MPAAVLLFCDIVGFSRESDPRQKLLIKSLTKRATDSIGHLLARESVLAPRAFALPTGDGFAVAFLDDEGFDSHFKHILTFAIALQQWSHTQAPPVQLRIGLHQGLVWLVEDVNGRQNVCGDTINFCQRVMDAANPGQVLASDALVASRFGHGRDAAITIEQLATTLRPVSRHDVLAKHGRRIDVHVLATDPEDGWDTQAPQSKRQVLVEFTAGGKPLDDFLQRVARARAVALVQLTGYRLAEMALDGTLQLATDLDRFWVVVPQPGTTPGYLLAESDRTGRDAGAYVATWKNAVARIRELPSRPDARLFVTNEPMFFGASYLDWTQPGGRIHVSPYVWGKSAREAPGFDLDWAGGPMPEVFRAYVEGLGAVRRADDASGAG